VTARAPEPVTRRLVAEFAGSALLVTVVIGSGIAAEALSPTDVGLWLLENAVATALGLGVLSLAFGPVSGTHFNHRVSLTDWLLGRRAGVGIDGRTVCLYTVVQVPGAGCRRRRPGGRLLGWV
jgi:glycerol uptake facilitator-like aquaporin